MQQLDYLFLNFIFAYLVASNLKSCTHGLFVVVCGLICTLACAILVPLPGIKPWKADS